MDATNLQASVRQPTWFPPYLQRRALTGFFVSFSGCVIALQALLAKSNRNNGIAESSHDFYYLWTYGPTAILTLLAMFWSRVEYETKIIAPWLHMHNGPTEASKSVLLDYLSMLQPEAVWKSLRNKDYAVSAATSISMTVRAIIPISTSLITLSSIPLLRSNIPVTLKSEFIDDISGLEQYRFLALQTLLGMTEFSGHVPDGISPRFAYQLVESDLPLSTPFTTTVDGLSMDLSCQQAHAEFPPALNDSKPVTLASDQCNFTITFGEDIRIYQGLHNEFMPGLAVYNNINRYVGGAMPGRCRGSSNHEDQRLGIIFAYVNCKEPINSIASFTDTVNF